MRVAWRQQEDNKRAQLSANSGALILQMCAPLSVTTVGVCDTCVYIWQFMTPPPITHKSPHFYGDSFIKCLQNLKGISYQVH